MSKQVRAVPVAVVEEVEPGVASTKESAYRPKRVDGFGRVMSVLPILS